MAYLNVDTNFFEHRKTRRLIGLLGSGSEVMPIRLWAYCGKFHAEDGSLEGYTEREIESCVGWAGESGKLVASLCKVGFLHKTSTGYKVHDWQEFQGHIHALKVRAQKGAEARWAAVRGDKPPDSDANGNANGNARSNAPSEPSNPSLEHPPNPPASGGADGRRVRRKRETREERAARKHQERVDNLAKQGLTHDLPRSNGPGGTRAGAVSEDNGRLGGSAA